MATLQVYYPPWVVYVARVQRTGDPTNPPTWANWREESRLRVLDILTCSSIVGQSYARIALSSGLPHSRQVDVEYARDVLWHGDRVAIGLQVAPRQVDWLFCGYCLNNSLRIDDKSEARVFMIVGPEWVWGDDNEGRGADLIVRGQFRRIASADDTWQNAQSTVTPYDQWEIFSDEQAIFNPRGMKNMTLGEVVITSPGEQPQKTSNIWETPNRRIASVDVASYWDMRRACKTLVEEYNDPSFSGIQSPDWDQVSMSILDIMRETSVEGMGLYPAIKRILENKFAFWINPKPAKADGTPVQVRGNSWGPFQLNFFSRTSGPSAKFVLNRRDTDMRNAVASVARLEAVRDIRGAINRVLVRGKYVRALKLIYWGGRTPTLPANLKKTALQHAWTTAQGDLTVYDAADLTISPGFYGVAALKRTEWLSRYNAGGKEFPSFWNVFRRFTWNESAEMPTTSASKYAAASFNNYMPDLTGIADTPEHPFYCRRKRRPLDTLVLRKADSSSWNRQPPTLYAAVAPDATSSEWDNLKWRKLSEANYKLDEDQCAVTFTADDLSEYRPFNKQDMDDQAADADKWPNDPRSFATLLNQGTLRLCLECSIPVDAAMLGIADRTESSGSPFIREAMVEAQDNFYQTLSYAGDGLASPSGQPILTVDNSAAATQQATITQRAAEDERIHSSIITSGDWPEQAIGSMLTGIEGRAIDMRSASGRGAQIVAVRIDPNNIKYEYMTESVALATTRRDRKLIGQARIFRDAKRRRSFSDE